jgi:ATP-dependent DNA ligase
LPARAYVLDGELMIRGQEFDSLQLRLHPAASRIAKLSKEMPASFVAYDMLGDEAGESLLERPFAARRAALERFFGRVKAVAAFSLSEQTRSLATARTWLAELGHGLDGIVAKRCDLPYRPGQRAMQKFKLWRTVDCVVGGLYLKPDGRTAEYLLLGLYDSEGLLNYVGRCEVRTNAEEITALVQPLLGGTGFTGKAPGGPSRWSGRVRKAVPLRPVLVAEVSADHIEAGRFRHGSRFLRWREDKPAEACTMAQIAPFVRHSGE